MRLYDEPVSIATIAKTSYPAIFDLITKNVEPTYRDVVISEHLYSVDCMDDVEEPISDVVDFCDKIKEVRPDIAYFRFIQP